MIFTIDISSTNITTLITFDILSFEEGGIMAILKDLFSSAAVYLINLIYLILVGAAGSTLSGFIIELSNAFSPNIRIKSLGSSLGL